MPYSVEERCLSRMPADARVEGVNVSGSHLSIRGALVQPVDRPAGAVRTAVIMLPQVGAYGFCGWLPYAATLAEAGVTTLPVDLCGFRDSHCQGRPELSTQVDAIATYLRTEHHADRVVLMGASMGGAQTVLAVSEGADMAAWVDVSGPSSWDGRTLLDVARRVRPPGLVVRAKRDGDPAEFVRAQRLARQTGATFLGVHAGHGWDLVLSLSGRPTRIGKAILAFTCPSCHQRTERSGQANAVTSQGPNRPLCVGTHKRPSRRLLERSWLEGTACVPLPRRTNRVGSPISAAGTSRKSARWQTQMRAD